MPRHHDVHSQHHRPPGAARGLLRRLCFGGRSGSGRCRATRLHQGTACSLVGFPRYWQTFFGQGSKRLLILYQSARASEAMQAAGPRKRPLQGPQLEVGRFLLSLFWIWPWIPRSDFLVCLHQSESTTIGRLPSHSFLHLSRASRLVGFSHLTMWLQPKHRQKALIRTLPVIVRFRLGLAPFSLDQFWFDSLSDRPYLSGADSHSLPT